MFVSDRLCYQVNQRRLDPNSPRRAYASGGVVIFVEKPIRPSECDRGRREETMGVDQSKALSPLGKKASEKAALAGSLSATTGEIDASRLGPFASKKSSIKLTLRRLPGSLSAASLE
jgi:hypothetical protein